MVQALLKVGTHLCLRTLLRSVTFCVAVTGKLLLLCSSVDSQGRNPEYGLYAVSDPGEWVASAPCTFSSNRLPGQDGPGHSDIVQQNL